MFGRLRDPGLWTLGSTVDPAEWEALDDHQSKALDMYGGGAYAPVADIAIGGAPGVGWTFDLPVTCSEDALLYGDNFEVYSSTIILGADGSDSLVVNSDATLYGLVDFENDVQFQQSVFCYDDVTLNSDVTVGASALLDVYGDSHFRGTMQIGDTGADALDVYAFSQFHDVVGFSGLSYFYAAVSLQAPLTSSGSGYLQARKVSRQAIGGDADASYAPTSYDHVHVPSGAISATRSYTIDDTGAVNGDRMRFTNLDPNHAISVKNPGGTQIAQIKADLGGKMGVEVERVTGNWQAIGLMVTPV